VPLLILLALEFIFYQAYFFIPVHINGEDIMARKKTTVWDFLQATKKMPENGNLVSIDKNVLKKGQGLPPVIKVNGVKRSFNYYLQANDKVTTFKGEDSVEPLIKEKRQTKKLVQNYGHGALIIIAKKGKPGINEVVYGKYSKKVVSEKVIAEPIPTGISKMNIRKHRVIALTFDDGPSKYTLRVLRTLEKYHVKATFFVIGRQIQRYPKYLKRMKKDGDVIGNHTFNHIMMGKSNGKIIKDEINKTDHWVYKVTKLKTKWIRPPGGSLRQSVVNYYVMRGKNIALWNVDTDDWKKPPVKVIEDRVIAGFKPGQVILLHDGGGNRENTIASLPRIIKEAKKRHYKFVTLDELYKDVRPFD
jgi:peptidoglycan/xylan/chitin deacetylase (PgdA/CDA1 family)